MEEAPRFGFGANWRAFLDTVDDGRVEGSARALSALLERDSLDGLRLLDAGSGSGLSSLAARNLGARVHSFDYDQDSVAATRALRQRYRPDDPDWTVEQGSVLDADYLEGLGQFDIVYSWGVLHHTGAMWQALDNVIARVAPGGLLAIALYNDQGGASQRWLRVKRAYVRAPKAGKWALVLAAGLMFEVRSALIRLVRFQNPLPFADWRKRREVRGMSVIHDLVDWVGGYPFEVARPEQVLARLRPKGFVLLQMTTCAGGHGCNEFLFQRMAHEQAREESDVA